MNILARHWRLIRIFVVATISTQLEYRVNFLMAVLGSLTTAGTALLGLGVIFGQPGMSSIGGWNFKEALLVTAFYLLTSGVIEVFIRPNMSEIAEAIRTGNMDFALLKPIDAQFNISTRHINILRVPDILIGIGLLAYAISGISVTILGIFLSVLMYLSSIIIVYCLWLALSTTAFWFVKTQNATELFQGVFGAARFPVTAFPVPVRALLTFVIPIAFVTTVPAQALIGKLTPLLALTSPLVALLLFGASRWFWLKAVSSYTSASS